MEVNKNMETQRLKNRLWNVFYDIEEQKYDSALAMLDLVLKEIENNKSEPFQIVETKNSIKLTKNSRGYNWEVRLVEKPNVDLLKQLDFVKEEMDKRIKKWNEMEK